MERLRDSFATCGTLLRGTLAAVLASAGLLGDVGCGDATTMSAADTGESSDSAASGSATTSERTTGATRTSTGASGDAGGATASTSQGSSGSPGTVGTAGTLGGDGTSASSDTGSGTTSDTSGTTGATQGPPRPNIVIIVADDLGWNDVGFHGSEIQTPHIDSIAADGMAFDHFYTFPVCTPTRIALMTGRYPIRMGIRGVVRPWSTFGLPPEEQTLPELLATAGYEQRAAIGKWHLGVAHVRYHPLNQGFTSFYGAYSGAIDYFTHVREGERDWHRDFASVPEDDGQYSTHLIAAEAENFILDQPNGAAPFFLYVPFNAPHTPFQAPQEYLDEYAHITDTRRRTYAAMVAAMDDGIGRILDALGQSGFVDNTLVLFFSDNGGLVTAGSNDPLRGYKSQVFEGGVRVAAAVRWPEGGLVGGGTLDFPMQALDVLPTLAGILEIEPTGLPLDGVDQAGPLLTGETPTPHVRYTYLATDKGEEQEQLAVYDYPWKFIHKDDPLLANPTGPKKLLFDLSTDPLETTNVKNAHPDLVTRYTAMLVDYRNLLPADAPPLEDVLPVGWVAPSEWEMPGE